MDNRYTSYAETIPMCRRWIVICCLLIGMRTMFFNRSRTHVAMPTTVWRPGDGSPIRLPLANIGSWLLQGSAIHSTSPFMTMKNCLPMIRIWNGISECLGIGPHGCYTLQKEQTLVGEPAMPNGLPIIRMNFPLYSI